MYPEIEEWVARLTDAAPSVGVCRGVAGLEKEALRVSASGKIAETPHPRALGSALTHRYITTDYSEALLELITPPLAKLEDALGFLDDAHKFVYDNLEHETLWATSMPCILEGEDRIPIAQYGRSNAGMMKTAYRRGLGHRYGRVMQVIAGVHFNFSFDEPFWALYSELAGNRRSQTAFRSEAYMGLIRNLQRVGWLVPYLFGASPAVCKSFLGGRPSRLEAFDDYTYYFPYATSLRMGDIGYQNSREEGAGVKACYDSLDDYIESLRRATETPSPRYREIGVKVGDRYEQLNANILQIENEYYSSVRPKQLLDGFEKPILALRRRGIRYIELRSLDVNAFHPLGVELCQLHFLRMLMLFCLLAESPPLSLHERREVDRNLGGTAHRGRDPRLFLQRNGRELRLRDWGLAVCDALVPIAALLDRGLDDRPHAASLAEQRERLLDPERTPSARMLAEMRARNESFFLFAQRMSLEHRDGFRRRQPAPARQRLFEAEATASLARQRELEVGDGRSFDRFLADYFAQQ